MKENEAKTGPPSELLLEHKLSCSYLIHMCILIFKIIQISDV